MYSNVVLGNPELSIIWTDISNIYMDGTTYETPEVQKESIHGFLLVAKFIPSEIRPIIYDILCKFVKQEDYGQIR